MSAIRLLVLGAVRQHGRAHGYQVRNDLEYWGAHEWSNAKPGSIYHALKQMAKQGLLHAHEIAPSTAGGPPRTEYEITEKGTEEYLRLVREALVAYDQKMDVKSAAIGFMVWMHLGHHRGHHAGHGSHHDDTGSPGEHGGHAEGHRHGC